MNKRSAALNTGRAVQADWSTVCLTDVVFFQEGPGLRKWQWTDSGMKVINVTNILADGRFDTTNTSRFISMEEFDRRYHHFAVHDRDIVVASSGNTYGKVARISARDLPLMMNTSVIRFRSADRERLEDDFLYAFLRSHLFRQQVEAFVIGSAQPNFGPSHLKQMKMPLPALGVQRQVAGIVSAYDDLIEYNLRRIQILEAMARTVHREWCVELRAPGVSPASEDGLPAGWRLVRLASIADVNRAQINTRTPPDRVRYIDISSVGPGMVREISDMAFAEAPGRARRIVQHGDILWSCVRPNRRSHALVLSPDPDTVASTGFAVLTAIKVPFTFLYQATTTDAFVAHLTNHATGAAYPAVTAKTFEDAEILLPPADLLERFAQATTPMAELIASLQRQNVNLRATRDLLLPRLMSGQLRLSDLEADPLASGNDGREGLMAV
jgi:type I restriction enzyme, S subunit